MRNTNYYLTQTWELPPQFTLNGLGHFMSGDLQLQRHELYYEVRKYPGMQHSIGYCRRLVLPPISYHKTLPLSYQVI